MADLKLFKPLNMFSLPTYQFRREDEADTGGYEIDRWTMSNDLRLVVAYDPADDDQVAGVGIGKPSGLHFLLTGTSFVLTDRDEAAFENGRLYGYLDRALAGDDIITGSSGVDAIRGFTGSDTINAESGSDLIYGNEGSDFLIGNMGNDTVYGGDGDDFVAVGRGADKAFGNAGSDWVVVEGPKGVTVDLQRSEVQKIGATATAQFSGFENIIGTTGSDRLFGNNGVNILTASNGNDVVSGLSGDDILAGGQGSDTLYGGAGADSFMFQTGAGRDYIRDFQVGRDEIGFTEGPTEFSELTIRQDGRYALVIYGTDWIRLDNVDAASLTANDFDFSLVVA